MAFGVTATTVMLSFGTAPAQASAIVHIAEIFTTAASGASSNAPQRYLGLLASAATAAMPKDGVIGLPACG